jgi:TPR repeat protein
MVDELSEEDGRRTKWWLPTGMIVMTLVVAGVVIGLVVSKRSNAPSDYATAPQLVLPSEKVSATSQRTISVASAESPSEAQVSAGSNFGASKDEDIAPKIAPSQEAPPQAVAPSKDTPPQTSAAVAPSKEPSKDTASQSPATVAPSANSPPQTFAAVAPSQNTPPQASAAVVPSQNTPPQAPAAVAPSQKTSPQSSAARQSPGRAIDKEELANLLERGRYLLSVGDISSARLLLERAAEAQEASAAFDLAGTYDPAVLGRSRALGIAPDLAMARLWYEKALKLGYSEAERRLARLQR